MTNILRTCTKCKQIKLITAFCTDKTNKSGLQCWCRQCKTDYARQIYATDKGKAAHKVAHRKWRGKTNRQCQAELLAAAKRILPILYKHSKVLQLDDDTQNAISELNIAVHQIEII